MNLPEIPIDPNLVVDMIQKRAWLPLGALALGLLIRLFKSDVKIFPTWFGPRTRQWACFGFGQVLGAVEAVIAGKTYKEAILWGLVQSSMAILGHETVIESFRGGKEIPIPGLMKPIVLPSPPPSPDLVPTDPPKNPNDSDPTLQP